MLTLLPVCICRRYFLCAYADLASGVHMLTLLLMCICRRSFLCAYADIASDVHMLTLLSVCICRRDFLCAYANVASCVYAGARACGSSGSREGGGCTWVGSCAEGRASSPVEALAAYTGPDADHGDGYEHAGDDAR